MQVRLCAALGALAAISPAVAQDDRQSTARRDVSTLEQIVVTARRVAARLQDVPISITVLNQEQLDSRNITTTSQLATYTPSLMANERFGPDKAFFVIRGFSMLETTSPTVGIYFADVVAPRAIAGTASGNGAGPGNYFDLQNVQVLKGPQGTLFGRNTTGGAILLAPRKPTDELEGYVEVSGGNYDLRRAQAVFNAPLAEAFRMRFGVDWQERDGYLTNRSGIGPEDFGDSNYISARASLVADLTPNVENYLVARYTESDTNGILFRMVGCNRGNDPSRPRTGRALVYAQPGCDQLVRNEISFRNIGLYAQGTYEITEQFAITTGVRYTMDRIEGEGGRVTARFPTPNSPVGNCAHPALATVVTLDPSNCVVGPFIEESEGPTWVIDLQYKPTADVMLYGSTACA